MERDGLGQVAAGSAVHGAGVSLTLAGTERQKTEGVSLGETSGGAALTWLVCPTAFLQRRPE